MARNFLGEQPGIKVDGEIVGAKWVTVDSAGFNGNLSPSDNNLQLCMEKLDDLVSGGGPPTNINGGTASTVGCVIQSRHDLSSNWSSVNPILSIGEIAISNDLSNFKVGNGVSTWSALPYFIQPGLSNEDVQDIVGAFVVNSASVSFTYNDSANTLTAAVIPSGVDHNSLNNFDLNKHVDHTLVSITARNRVKWWWNNRPNEIYQFRDSGCSRSLW